MAKSYFAVLGISPKATGGEVKSAYRRLAKECHPDRCPGGDEKFCQIQEAYAVLGDSRRRREYEESMRHARPTPPRSGHRPEPLRPVNSPRAPENLFPHRSRRPHGRLFGEIVDRTKHFTVEISLTPEQMRRGGTVGIRVPVRSLCPTCHGYGEVGFFECPRCAGSGVAATEIPLSVSFPPDLARGHSVSIPLDRFGMRHVLVTVIFRPSRLRQGCFR